MMNLQGNAATGVRPGQENGGDGPPLAPTRRLLIGGHLVVNGRTFPPLNPATGEILGHAPDATAADAEACVAAARRAFDTTSWATDVDLRVRCLNQLYQALTEHKEELRELTIAEVGAPLMLTLANQLDVPIEIVRFYANLLESYPMTENLSDVEFRGQRHRRRGGGRDNPVQLPQPDWAGQAGPRARRRVHGGAQGGSGHAPDHAGAGRADRQPHRHPARRGQRAVLVRGSGRRSAHHAS